mgnify:CR=1 FL=1
MDHKKEKLQKILDQNYKDYMHRMHDKPVSDIMQTAERIVAARQLREELTDACGDSEIEALLQLENALEMLIGHWVDEMSGIHKDEMSYMLWRLQDSGTLNAEQTQRTIGTTEREKNDLSQNEGQDIDFSSEQIEQIDVIDNTVYQSILVFLDKTEDEFPWDMHYIGSVADAVEKTLVALGQRVRRPAIITERDGTMYIEEYQEPAPDSNRVRNKKEKHANER